jgi:hypothetical protein
MEQEIPMLTRHAVLLFALSLSVWILAPGTAAARDQMRIVGSSTVYPFATVVAEEFGRSSSFKTPIIESTGTGGGLKLFCAGVGVQHPDITNASRRIKQSEVDLCAENGVTALTEIKIGYDGIVLANSRKAAPMALTLRQVFVALAKEVPAPNGDLVANPNQTWRDVDASLPAVKIEVLGPPPTSGTRDAFNELALEGGCKTFSEVAALKKKDKAQYKKICRSARSERRRDPGRHGGWRRAELRQHRAGQLSGLAVALLLREERPRELDSGHARVPDGIHQREGGRRLRLPDGSGPDLGARGRAQEISSRRQEPEVTRAGGRALSMAARSALMRRVPPIPSSEEHPTCTRGHAALRTAVARSRPRGPAPARTR